MNIANASFIKMTTNKPEETKLIRIEPVEKKEDYSGLEIFTNILLGVASVGAAFLTGGASLLAEGVIAGLSIATTSIFNELEGRETTAFDIIFPVAGFAMVAPSIISAARQVKNLANATETIAQEVKFAGLTERQTEVVLSNVDNVVGGSVNAKNLGLALERAGLTDKESIKIINTLRDELKNANVRAQTFYDDVDFVNQESRIFREVTERFGEAGIELNQVISNLREVGIDLKGLQSLNKLTKEIKQNPAIYNILKNKGDIEVISSFIQKDLEPTFITTYLNANKIERGVAKFSRNITLINPNKLIKKVVKRAFKPLEEKVDHLVWSKLEKKAMQKIRHLLAQDTVRKYKTKNGVYPCFASSWINYLRAIPYGNGIFKCFVIFRKRGHQPVLITPPLDLKYIINWSESSSPGRIYHEFRSAYGVGRGQQITVDQIGNNAFEFFNLLGFIPNKYLRLGISLIGNVATAVGVIKSQKWTGDIGKIIKENIVEEGIESVVGKWGGAIFKQTQGEQEAIKQYITGRVNRVTRRGSSEATKQRRKAQAQLKMGTRIENLKDKF